MEPFAKGELDLSETPLRELNHLAGCISQLTASEICDMGIAMCERYPDDEELSRFFVEMALVKAKAELDRLTRD